MLATCPQGAKSLKVLIVDEEVPWPLDTGKRIRTYNLVHRLQQRHQVFFLCYGAPGAVLPDCPNVSLVTLPSPVIEQRGAGFYLALAANLFSRKPYIVDRHFSPAMAQAASDLFQRERCDLLHCEWTPYSENLGLLLGRVPSVLSAHNVEAQIWERYFQAEANPLKKGYIYLQWQKLLAYERQVAGRYGKVVVVSEPDRDAFTQSYGCRDVTVVPNGVDERYFAPQPRQVERCSMVFTGSMDWRPNQDGVAHFLKAIFPLIKRELPAATFTVVGRKPPAWLVELAGRIEGVTVTGTVDDVRPFVAKSALYVVPLRVGGGSRLKILEAMAMGKVVLSTAIGAEGLAVADGREILLRDTPEAFAQTACAVLRDPASYQRFGAAGRELVCRSYTWDSIARVLDGAWEAACV